MIIMRFLKISCIQFSFFLFSFWNKRKNLLQNCQQIFISIFLLYSSCIMTHFSAIRGKNFIPLPFLLEDFGSFKRSHFIPEMSIIINIMYYAFQVLKFAYGKYVHQVHGGEQAEVTTKVVNRKKKHITNCCTFLQTNGQFFSLHIKETNYTGSNRTLYYINFVTVP